jgi:hypothetical protein
MANTCIFIKTFFHVIDHLKPTGHVMHQQFNIQQLYALPTQYFCVLYLSENKLTASTDWFYKRDEKCLQRGKDWVFKLSSLRFVFKGLKHYPFHSLGSTVWSHILQLVLWFYTDLLFLNVLCTFSLIHDLEKGNLYYQ